MKKSICILAVLVVLAFLVFNIPQNTIPEGIDVFNSDTGAPVDNKFPLKIDIKVGGISFDSVKSSSADFSEKAIIIKTQELKTNIEKNTRHVVKDFLWVENKGLVPKDTSGTITLSSIGRKTFKCDGTVDNPECFEIQSCSVSIKPCYVFDSGKTIVFVNHFSGAFNTMTWTTDDD